jgi:hypothetical protein
VSQPIPKDFLKTSLEIKLEDLGADGAGLHMAIRQLVRKLSPQNGDSELQTLGLRYRTEMPFRSDGFSDGGELFFAWKTSKWSIRSE